MFCAAVQLVDQLPFEGIDRVLLALQPLLKCLDGLREILILVILQIGVLCFLLDLLTLIIESLGAL